MGRVGKLPPLSTVDLFKQAEFFAGIAEPNMNLTSWLVDFCGKFLDTQTDLTGGIEEFDDLLLHETFRRAWLFWALGDSPALLDGFGADEAGCGENLARGQGRDVFFDFGNFGEQGFFFLGEGKKCRQSLRIDICYFH